MGDLSTSYNYGSSGLGKTAAQGCFVLFLGKTLNPDSASCRFMPIYVFAMNVLCLQCMLGSC